MKRLALAALMPLFAAMPTAPAADAPAAPAPRLESMLPRDCVMALVLEDARALGARWEKGPLARTWADPQVVKFLAPLRANLEIERWDEHCQAATGHTVREFLDIFQGQAVLAVTSLRPRDGGEAPPPPETPALPQGGDPG